MSSRGFYDLPSFSSCSSTPLETGTEGAELVLILILILSTEYMKEEEGEMII
jgi:hypothetical protein